MSFAIGLAEQGVVVGSEGRVAVVEGVTRVEELIADWGSWRDRLAGLAGQGQALEPTWRAPLAPPKLICVGANYNAHNREMLGEFEQPFPYLFLKPPSTTVRPHGAVVPYPAYAEKLDYEAELAVVMGAAGDVFGYTLCNDLSVRDWVPGPTLLGIDWVMAKGFDGSAPLGPWITPAEFVPDPQALRVRLWVNDELRQDSSTSDMTFSVAEVVAHCARVLTLEPGDVIATGTPSGVGLGFKPPRLLERGDRVRMEIEGLGVLETAIAKEEETDAGSRGQGAAVVA